MHPRNAMSLANAGYLPVLTWANPLQTRLEQQALVPMFGESPVEMGMAGREQYDVRPLRREPVYPPLFRAAFPERRRHHRSRHDHEGPRRLRTRARLRGLAL